MKTPTKINPIAGERIRQIINECNENKSPEDKLTQDGLSEKIGVSAVHLNNIINGRKALTIDNARKLSELFPPTRIEWLLGMDEYRTEEERISALINRCWEEGATEDAFISQLLALLGVKFEPALMPEEQGVEDKNIIKSHDIWRTDKKSCRIYRSGLPVATCSLEDKDRFTEDIRAFAECWLSRLIEKGRIDNG